METMIAVITAMKMPFIVHREHARRTASAVQIIDAFRQRGTVMVTTIAVMELMNHQNIANQRDAPALAICLLVTMEIVYREFTFAMGTMIVWITAMKTIGISAVSRQVKIYFNETNIGIEMSKFFNFSYFCLF